MKKKLCSLLIAICLFAFVLLSFAACASSDLKYEAMYGDDSYWWSVSGSYGDSTVKIPKKHNGVAVRTISAWAFSGDKNLKKVTIPNTIDSIGGFAFDNCKSLKKVNLPRALKSIEHLLEKRLISVHPVFQGVQVLKKLSYLKTFWFSPNIFFSIVCP